MVAIEAFHLSLASKSSREYRRAHLSNHVTNYGMNEGFGSQPDPNIATMLLDMTTSTSSSINNNNAAFRSSNNHVHGTTASPVTAEGMAWSAEQICGLVAVMVIVPFILVGNLLVIASVLKFKRLQVPTNYFIVSLAVVDIFVATVTPLVIVLEVLPDPQVADFTLCLAPNRILMTACGVSLLTLASIAYDRHTALINPLEYASVMTQRKICLVVALTWVYTAAIVWAPLPAGWYLAAHPVEKRPTLRHCSLQHLDDNAHILFLCAVFGPACLAIVFCYFRIYTVARHHARAIAAVESSVQHNLRMRFMIKDAKYAKTLALVIGAFLLLWLPYLACLLVEVLTDVSISDWVWNYLTLLAVLNSGLNPWIYAYKNNEFRAAFRRILKSGCHPLCSVGARRSLVPRQGSRHSSTLSGASSTSPGGVGPGHTLSMISRWSSPTCVLSNFPCEKYDVSAEGPERGERKLVRSQSAVLSTNGPKLTCGGGVRCRDDQFAGQLKSREGSAEPGSPLGGAESKAFLADLLNLYFLHTVIELDVSSSEAEHDHNDSIDTTVSSADSVLSIDDQK